MNINFYFFNHQFDNKYYNTLIKYFTIYFDYIVMCKMLSKKRSL